jgi:hypothetical protein
MLYIYKLFKKKHNINVLDLRFLKNKTIKVFIYNILLNNITGL